MPFFNLDALRVLPRFNVALTHMQNLFMMQCRVLHCVFKLRMIVRYAIKRDLSGCMMEKTQLPF